MDDDHHFTVRIYADLASPGRFQWALLRAGQVYNTSKVSFATKREATAEAAKVLEKRVAAWQAAQLPERSSQ